MDRLSFSKAIENNKKILQDIVSEHFEELVAAYHIVEGEDVKVLGHLDGSELSLTVACKSNDDASNMCSNINDNFIEIYGTSLKPVTIINGNIIELKFNK